MEFYFHKKFGEPAQPVSSSTLSGSKSTFWPVRGRYFSLWPPDGAASGKIEPLCFGLRAAAALWKLVYRTQSAATCPFFAPFWLPFGLTILGANFLRLTTFGSQSQRPRANLNPNQNGAASRWRDQPAIVWARSNGLQTGEPKQVCASVRLVKRERP